MVKLKMVLLGLVWSAQGVAFMSSTASARSAMKQAMVMKSADSAVLTRRDVFGAGSAALAAFALVEQVDASGGATAGGAYLIRAKERYGSRVAAGAKEFKAAKAAVEAGDSKSLSPLFAKDAAYDDLLAAGYLLANAFRINSTQNPDKIPQVQKFKKFKAAADALPAALKKNKKVPADSYATASELLDDFLSSVGL